MPIYTYTIFDSNPHTSAHSSWPTHEDLEIEADDAAEAVDEVRGALSSAALNCQREDGYTVGDLLYALVWDETGLIVGEPTHELTAEELGADPSDSDELDAEQP